jgi:hypothetical protein
MDDDESPTASALYNAREQLKEGDFADVPAGKQRKGGRRSKRKGKGKEKTASDAPSVVPVVAMEDDVLTMPGQQFAVISFVDKRDYAGMSEGAANTSLAPQNLLKIRGVFPTYERAQSRVKELMLVDPYFDLHVIKCGEWSLIGAGQGEDITYENEGVNDIMQEFFHKHYTDVDALRGRINSAKADGLAGLDASDPSAFYGAAQGIGDAGEAAGSAPLPPGATRMAPAAAMSALSAGVTA